MTTSPDLQVQNLNDLQIRAIQSEYLARQRAKEAAGAFLEPTEQDLELAQALYKELFKDQREFFDSPSRRKLGFCSRRAGKTMGLARWQLITLLRKPSSLQLYFAQTSLAAKTYIWPELKQIIRKHSLPITWNEQDLWLIHKNGGGKIILRGAEDNEELDKHRGPAYANVFIDEAGHFKRNLKKLLSEVVGPALRDHGGTAYMTGTAGPQRSGYFYQACTGELKRKSDGQPVWEVHEWGLEDNPYLSAEAKDYTKIIDEDGFSGPDDPRFLREYKRIWAVDEEKRMFAFASDRNTYEGDLPEGHEWLGVLGLDFGWNDATAIAAAFYSLTSPSIYICETWAKSKQYTDDIAAKIYEFRARYGMLRIIGDVGGYGKSPAVHLARDYGIHVTAAKKSEKLGHLAFFNSALKRGELLVRATDDLCTQFPKVEWNPTRTGAANHARDDRCFAALYAWREAKSSGAGSKVVKQTEIQCDADYLAQRTKELAIKEKLDVLNKPEKEEGYAHQRPFQSRRNRMPHGRNASSFHQLVARRRP